MVQAHRLYNNPDYRSNLRVALHDNFLTLHTFRVCGIMQIFFVKPAMPALTVQALLNDY